MHNDLVSREAHKKAVYERSHAGQLINSFVNSSKTCLYLKDMPREL